MLLFHRDRKHDHRISRAGLARIMYQNITTIYAYVFTVHEPTSTRIHKLAQTKSHYDHSLVFLLRTVDGSGNLLIMPINGTNHNGRARFFRKMKIKEIACHQELIIVRLFLIKQSAIVSNPSVLNQLTLVISLTSPKNR